MRTLRAPPSSAAYAAPIKVGTRRRDALRCLAPLGDGTSVGASLTNHAYSVTLAPREVLQRVVSRR